MMVVSSKGIAPRKGGVGHGRSLKPDKRGRSRRCSILSIPYPKAENTT